MARLDVSSPINYPLRPINQGMIKNLPTNAIPNGAFLRLQNYRVDNYGLKKRGGFITFDRNEDVDPYNQYNERLEHFVYFYRKNAETEMDLISNKRIYRTTAKNSTTPYRLYEDITINLNDAALTGELMDITILASMESYELTRGGDYLVSEDKTLAIGPFVSIGAYDSFNGQFPVTIRADRDYTENELNGIEMELDHYFKTEDNFNVSYAVLPYTEAVTSADEAMIIADQADRGLYSLSGGQFGLFEMYADIQRSEECYMNSAKGVTYFSDRLWAFSTSEKDGVQYSQRIRWSFPGNFDVFRTEDYIDLPYSEGEIIALEPLGSLLIAYFTDAVYIGRQSSIIDLPYKFERLETGNVGLVNQKAVVPWIDGHFFVGQDNIYFVSGAAGIQAIGDPVLQETLEYTDSLKLTNKIQVEHDPPTNTVVFYFPDLVDEPNGIETGATRLWRWNYRTQGWSYDECSFFNAEKTIPDYYFTSLLSSRLYVFNRSWQYYINLGTGDPDEKDKGAVWVRDSETPEDLEAFSDYNKWADLSDELRRFKQLYIGTYHNSVDNKMIILEESLEGDQDYILDTEYPVWCLIESADYDLGVPDTTKTFTRLTAKSFRNMTDRSAPLVDDRVEFELRLSPSFGYSWKRPKRMRFRRNYNEAKGDFRCTGSSMRFKLINNQVVRPYKLSEFVIRAIGIGLQVRE